MLEKIQNILGTQGLRLMSKIILIIAGFSLFTKKPDILADLLSKTYGMDFLAGANIMGALVLLIAIMMHKNLL